MTLIVMRTSKFVIFDRYYFSKQINEGKIGGQFIRLKAMTKLHSVLVEKHFVLGYGPVASCCEHEIGSYG